MKFFKSKYIFVFLLILILSLAFTGCQGKTDQKDNDKPTVAVSIVPQETFVREIAGDRVNIVTMIPPGSSAETYSPTPKELQSFSDAKIFFSISVPAEEANILPKAKDFNKDVKIVDLAGEIAKVYPDIEFAPGKRDPHIWLSPKRMKIAIDIMAKELALMDPEGEDIYLANAKRYIEELESAEEDVKKSLENLENKTFIAYHPAFAYFAEDFDLVMVALEEEGKEATPQNFKAIIDLAKEEGIKVIFYQAEVDSRQSEAFAKEIDGKTEKIAPLAPDYTDNLRKMAKTFSEVLKEGE